MDGVDDGLGKGTGTLYQYFPVLAFGNIQEGDYYAVDAVVVCPERPDIADVADRFRLFREYLLVNRCQPLQYGFRIRQQVRISELARYVTDRSSDIGRDKVEKTVCNRCKAFDTELGVEKECGYTGAAQEVVQDIGGFHQFRDFLLELAVDRDQLLVQGLEFLFRGLQFLVGRLEFLIN